MTVRELKLVFGFIIFFLCSIIIGLITWKFKDSTDVINQISLVSSISSILLAIIAIVYAFYQTFSSSKQTENLQRTLENMSEKVIQLQHVKDDLSFAVRNFEEIQSYLQQIHETNTNNRTDIVSVLDYLKGKDVQIPEEVEKDILDSTEEMAAILPWFGMRSYGILSYLKSNYKPGEIISMETVNRRFNTEEEGTKSYKKTGIVLKRRMDELCEQGYLKSTEINGYPVYTLTNKELDVF
ncbi:hypothetical protein [Paenibacillus thermotolerans]|nr:MULTISPECIES: hypothetical protein [unclassified Paenibacillus]